MENKNISVLCDDTKFNFRVAVIIENNGRVLLENLIDFWNMIGGRVQFGESTFEGAKRELKEELDLTVDDLKLIHVAENFFEWEGKIQQELVFVYKLNLGDNCKLTKQNSFKSLDDDKVFTWHKIEDVKNLVCKPEIIKQLVIKSDEIITHTIAK